MRQRTLGCGPAIGSRPETADRLSSRTDGGWWPEALPAAQPSRSVARRNVGASTVNPWMRATATTI